MAEPTIYLRVTTPLKNTWSVICDEHGIKEAVAGERLVGFLAKLTKNARAAVLDQTELTDEMFELIMREWQAAKKKRRPRRRPPS